MNFGKDSHRQIGILQEMSNEMNGDFCKEPIFDEDFNAVLEQRMLLIDEILDFSIGFLNRNEKNDLQNSIKNFNAIQRSLQFYLQVHYVWIKQDQALLKLYHVLRAKLSSFQLQIRKHEVLMN